MISDSQNASVFNTEDNIRSSDEPTGPDMVPVNEEHSDFMKVEEQTGTVQESIDASIEQCKAGTNGIEVGRGFDDACRSCGRNIISDVTFFDDNDLGNAPILDEIPIPEATPIISGREYVVDGVIVSSERTKKLSLTGKIYVLLQIVIIIAIPILIWYKVDKKNDPTLKPTSYPSVSLAPSTHLNHFIKDLLIPISGEDILDNLSSPQHHAWKLTVKAVPQNLISALYNMNDTDHIIQRYIIMVLALSMSGSFHTDADKYISTQLTSGSFPHECNMFDCNEKGELTTLFVSSEWFSGLFGNGFLPKEIGFLSSLKHLVLSKNGIKGTIPTEIGKLQTLKILDLRENFLTGIIPKEIGNLESLEWIRLDGNRLSSTIPSNMGNLTNLLFFNFSSNALTGEIPSQIDTIKSLKGLATQKNNLTGSIEFLCDNGLNNESFTEDVPIGKSMFVEQHYSFSIDTGIHMDCHNDVPSLSCSCCLCLHNKK